MLVSPTKVFRKSIIFSIKPAASHGELCHSVLSIPSQIPTHCQSQWGLRGSKTTKKLVRLWVLSFLPQRNDEESFTLAICIRRYTEGLPYPRRTLASCCGRRRSSLSSQTCFGAGFSYELFLLNIVFPI